METELIIEGCDFPPLSARGCSQELTVVDQGTFRRSVNGSLVYMGPFEHKYKSIITCEDKVTLVNERVLSRGMEVRIGCLQRLWQQGKPGLVTLERDAVAGSVAVIDAMQKPVNFVMIDTKTVQIISDPMESAFSRPAELNFSEPVFSNSSFISYRPWLLMRVISLKLHTNEWGLKAGWQLELEEV
ncbi:MAG: hypothetical protein Q8S21_06760 [Candidatus Paracaedibacteraceae bacterium]|nr:hypothetical protein [Candidatus Paracaedibacteraceae bacterium]